MLGARRGFRKPIRIAELLAAITAAAAGVIE